MAFGPLTIFDKSFLQSLNPDEAIWFDNFFRTIITPLFFVETLADLEKEVAAGKTPEQVVGEIAYKTPEMNATPNVHHFNLVISNLLGYPVEMDRRPIISGGTPKVAEGGYGLFFEEFPEAEALSRWQNYKFLETEREFAKDWRSALNNSDFESSIAMAGNIVPQTQRFSDLSKIKDFIDTFLANTDEHHFQLLFEILGIPQKARSKIIQRWVELGNPNLKQFAPYAYHVFSVDLFFFLSLAHGHISRERASNKVDIAYLYYLPFAHILVSNDKLHVRTAPLFLDNDQQFIHGSKIKPELHILNAYYETLPEEVKEEGIIRFASYPPQQIIGEIHRLWDKYLPIWRKHDVEDKSKPRASIATDSKLLEHLKANEKAPIYTGRQVSSDDARFVQITRNIRSKKGKWFTVPKEVAEKAAKEKKNS